MDTLTFFEPSNDGITNPSADQIVALMRQNGEYWGPYSPVGQLHQSGTPSLVLYFVRHPRRGWYFEYHATNSELPQANRRLVAIDSNGDRNGWVEHWAEGETAYFLDACFVPQVVAEQIVTDFMKTGQPSTVASWETLNWNLHRREAPPEDETLVLEEAVFPDPGDLMS